MLDAPTILSQLTKHDVEFVVIGDLAMVTHGSAHVTGDLDICYHRTEKNFQSLVDAPAPLHPFLRGAPVDLPFQFDSPTIRVGLNFTLMTDLGPVDLFGEVQEIGIHEQVTAQSGPYSISGMSIQVLSLEGLIAAKKSAGREKDKTHLVELEELKKLRDVQE